MLDVLLIYFIVSRVSENGTARVVLVPHHPFFVRNASAGEHHLLVLRVHFLVPLPLLLLKQLY